VKPLSWQQLTPVAFDFETSGSLDEYALQPWRVASRDAWATSMVAIGHEASGPREWGSLMPTREMLGDFLTDMLTRKATLIGWNTQFDVQWLMAYGFTQECHQLRWLDAMLLWKHLTVTPEYDTASYKKKSYSLKEAVREFLPQFAHYEAHVEFHSEDPQHRAELHHYNRQDTAFTLRLARQFYTQLYEGDGRQLRAALIEAQSIPLIAEANLRGMCVDVVAAGQLAMKLGEDADTALTALMLTDGTITPEMLRSPKQLGTLLFDRWQLPMYRTTASGQPSTDKETLHYLAEIDERVQWLQQYRESNNLRTKFAIGLVESSVYNSSTGRTHPQAHMFGTYSGRLTYSSKQGRGKQERPTGFALHQMKRDSAFRRLVTAPPGMALVEFDASGQEYRWMAIAANDPTMLNLCEDGEDPHAFMGAAISGMDYREVQHGAKHGDSDAKQVRQLGKVGNLSLQYRTGPSRLRTVAKVQYKIDLSDAMAVHTHGTYLRTYNRVPMFWDQQIRKAQRDGFVETLDGRRVHMTGSWSYSDRWAMESTAINYPIQGTGAGQKYLALAVLRPYLRTIGAQFAWDLHDGIYFYIPVAAVRDAIPHMLHTLNTLPYRRAWGLTPPIPLPWDCKIGRSWGDLQEYTDDWTEGLLSQHDD
jgi:DNA polymerase I-like protein with 3'-5' exonuclease and polymerase domains